MNDSRRAIHARLSRALVLAVDHYAVEHDLFRDQAWDRLVLLGLKTYLDQNPDCAPEVRNAIERALAP